MFLNDSKLIKIRHYGIGNYQLHKVRYLFNYIHNHPEIKVVMIIYDNQSERET